MHKAGVCEAKAHSTKITNNESVQQTTGAEGKALKLYEGPGGRKNTAQTAHSEAKYEY